jgi:hypothetical protein
MRNITRLLPLSLVFASAFTAEAAVIYSDVTTFSGFGFANGGAAVVGGNDITNVVADDINPTAGGVGSPITSITYSVANLNGSAVTFQPVLSIWAADGAGGQPGTLLTSLSLSATTQAAGTVALYTISQSTGFFLGQARFWAGLSFDDNGGAIGVTAAQLNNLGQGIFAPPTVGSSQDLFFGGSTPGQQGSNNPAGGLFFFGGNPVADFGWAFTATPEPGSALLVAGGLALAALLSKRRRG